MCDAYIPDQVLEQRLALFLYGFPATIGENLMTNFLLKNGYFVVQPHYPGTYDSGGKFTPQSAEEMVKTLLQELSGGKVKNLKDDTQIPVPHNVTLCVGYSFGCMITLRCLPFFKNLQSTILISPAISYGVTDLSSGFIENGPAFLDYIRRTRPYTYRLGNSKEWEKLYSGFLNIPRGEAPLSLETVIGISGAQDKSFNLPMLKKNFSPIVEKYAGNGKNITLQIIANAGHSVSNLINNSTESYLENELRLRN